MITELIVPGKRRLYAAFWEQLSPPPGGGETNLKCGKRCLLFTYNRMNYIQYSNDDYMYISFAGRYISIVGHHTIHYTIFYLQQNELYYVQYNNDDYIYISFAGRYISFVGHHTIYYTIFYLQKNELYYLQYSNDDYIYISFAGRLFIYF